MPAALEPSSPNSGRGVLRIAASAFGRRSLTPQDPLKNLRDLFRSTGPALNHNQRVQMEELEAQQKLQRERGIEGPKLSR